jgi:hypothetical protein
VNIASEYNILIKKLEGNITKFSRILRRRPRHKLGCGAKGTSLVRPTHNLEDNI